MIHFTLGNKRRTEATCQHTHANNRGIITTFVNRGRGNVSARSFSLADYNSVEEFLKSEYPNVKIDDN